jgi:hypothetical protein
MSASQTAETTTQQPPTVKTGNGARQTQTRARRAAPATAIRTDAPGQSTASRTAALTAAQAAARKERAGIAAAASVAARAAARAGNAGASAALASPVILDLVQMLPAPTANWTQQKAMIWMEAIGANLRVIYGFTGAINVSGTPAGS